MLFFSACANMPEVRLVENDDDDEEEEEERTTFLESVFPQEARVISFTLAYVIISHNCSVD